MLLPLPYPPTEFSVHSCIHIAGRPAVFLQILCSAQRCNDRAHLKETLRDKDQMPLVMDFFWHDCASCFEPNYFKDMTKVLYLVATNYLWVRGRGIIFIVYFSIFMSYSVFKVNFLQQIASKFEEKFCCIKK